MKFSKKAFCSLLKTTLWEICWSKRHGRICYVSGNIERSFMGRTKLTFIFIGTLNVVGL